MSRSLRVTAATFLLAAALPTGAAASQDLRSPDARDAAERPRLAVGHQDLRSPDARDAADGVQPVQPIVLPAPVDGDGARLDWRDVGIGATGGMAVMVIAAGIALAMTGRRRSTRRVASTS